MCCTPSWPYFLSFSLCIIILLSWNWEFLAWSTSKSCNGRRFLVVLKRRCFLNWFSMWDMWACMLNPSWGCLSISIWLGECKYCNYWFIVVNTLTRYITSWQWAGSLFHITIIFPTFPIPLQTLRGVPTERQKPCDGFRWVHIDALKHFFHATEH